VRQSRRLIAAVAAVLLVAVTLAACAADGPFPATASATQDLDVAVGATAPDLVVRVEMFNGPIEVRAGAVGRVTATVETTGVGGSNAEAEADRARIQVTLDANPDGSVLLRAVYQPNPGSPNNREASAVVEVPPDAALDLRTSNGTVTTSGISGPIDVRTSNGAANLAGPESGANVRTTNGAVEIDGTGLLDVQTTNGSVSIRGTDATLSVRTSNGDVSFDGTLSDSPQRVATTNNPITIRLPATAGFTIDARTTNAEVVLDGFTLKTTAPATEVAKQGIVGVGGPWLVLRTSNASIVVSAQ
jgi:predicted small lipoprotein YifL